MSRGDPVWSACTCELPWCSPYRLADGREDVDGAGLQRDDRPLRVLALTGAEPRAAGLARAVDRVHAGDLDAEDLLHGELDLGLVRARVDDERVLALVDQPVALLGDDRRDDDVARVLVERRAHAGTSSVVAAATSPVSTLPCSPVCACFAATKAS